MYFKKLFLVIILCLFSSVSWSQSNSDEEKIKCVEGNCENGSGTAIYSDGIYKGGFLSGIRWSDYGVMNYINGDRFEGEWRYSYRGVGKLLYANGDIYEGDMNYHNKGNVLSISVYGKMFDASEETIYSGHWYNGMREGYGEIEKTTGYNSWKEYQEAQKNGVLVTKIKGIFKEGKLISNLLDGRDIGRDQFENGDAFAIILSLLDGSPIVGFFKKDEKLMWLSQNNQLDWFGWNTKSSIDELGKEILSNQSEGNKFIYKLVDGNQISYEFDTKNMKMIVEEKHSRDFDFIDINKFPNSGIYLKAIN